MQKMHQLYSCWLGRYKKTGPMHTRKFHILMYKDSNGFSLLWLEQIRGTTHHAVLQACEEVASLQTVPDAALGAVVSLELGHVPLEQPLTEAVLVTTLILPELKQRNCQAEGHR